MKKFLGLVLLLTTATMDFALFGGRGRRPDMSFCEKACRGSHSQCIYERLKSKDCRVEDNVYVGEACNECNKQLNTCLATC